VYLFFSANRTGQFYGYARMESEIRSNSNIDSEGPILENTSENTYISSTTSWSSAMTPKIILTEADTSIPIPAGRIVDDSARGSLFWEILDTASENTEGMTGGGSLPSRRNWSTPFKILWLSPPGKTLPFHKTRHLQNSLNHNLPVRIARDGTEIDSVVGEKMIALFWNL
jgi:YT521-B-like domain